MRAPTRISVCVLFGIAVIIPDFHFAIVHAATRPATDADKAAIEAAGLKYIRGMIWDPDNPYVGKEAGDAKDFLRQRSTKGSNINCLNPQFAEKVRNMLKAIPSGMPAPIIDSGYRGRAAQERAKAAGNSGVGWCRSYHNYGLAVDLNNTGKQTITWLRANASQFGIRTIGHPVTGCMRRFCDPAHFQDAGGIRGQCGSCGNDQGDGVLPGSTSSGSPFPGAQRNNYDGASQMPTSGLTNAARNFFNPQPQEQMCALSDGKLVPCSSIANLGAQQPLPQQQQPDQLGQQPPQLGTDNTTAYAPGTCPPQFYCANDTYYYRSSTCVDQVQKKCEAGCSKTGNLCAATSTSSGSVFDQIENIAEPTGEEVGTPVSDKLFELAITGEDAVTLLDKAKPTTTAYDGPYVQPPLSEQTFTSDDLRNSPPQAAYRAQPLSGFQLALSTMKEVLLIIIEYLKPFNRPSVEEHYGEWAE